MKQLLPGVAALLTAIAVVTLVRPGAGNAPAGGWRPEEYSQILSLSLGALTPVPSDPSNRFADNPAAADFGRQLFFDRRLSPDGTVACASCHLPDRQYQDDRPQGRGVGLTARRTMPLAGAAYSPFLFWDGRADSLWAQALGPLESAAEHGGDRSFYAHLISRQYRGQYERVFGPLPDLTIVPERAGPLADSELAAAWKAMPEQSREAVNGVFANIGKAIGAFERTLKPQPTRFDAYAAALRRGGTPYGPEALSAEELSGLRLFIGKANCASCHNGPLLSDQYFHNTGVAGDLRDHGRLEALETVRLDPFNCLGRYSDAGPQDCAELRFMAVNPHEAERAYKTPSLRGSASRAPFMHAGQLVTLEDVIDHYSQAPQAPSGRSELRPLNLTQKEKAALRAFLQTLD